MPSFDQINDPPRKGKIIKSPFDSESFESDGTIHVDGLVGSATISPSGRDIALASPDGLAIIDLDSPYSPPRRLQSHGLPWLVTDVQWSPFAARDYWVVSTANHRALVWNLNLREDSNSGAIEHSLHGHSRAITDVNFSAHHPDILATCSVDGYVHSWDLRRPRQPVLTFCDWFAGATQVKYSRQDAHTLASTHDRWLHIWDDRKSSEPLKSISAHKSKIYGVDWNRIRPTAIVTCSLDKSIKFWDYANSVDEPEHVIHTDYPVWRARHTPFGRGLLAMPQNEPGDLYLYDRRRLDEAPTGEVTEPVAVFPGHGHHKAKEFLWRARGDIQDGLDKRDFQLVSWGTDNELRLQCLDTNVLSAVGFTKGMEAPKGINITRKGAAYKTFRTMDDASRDRKVGTMSDPRNFPGGAKVSSLTAGVRSGIRNRVLRTGWKGPSMKAKVEAKDGTQSQIGWLKGIAMAKRKPSSNTVPKRQMSKDSTHFGHGYPDDDWGEPDTVQEELLRISTQIPKVKWENIDMENLTMNASLNGPWGANGEPIFMRVRIDIPEKYPTEAAPDFFIEQTSFLPERTHRRLMDEIQQLGEKFLLMKQNCLEVAFTYLLGEIDLESSTTFFKVSKDLDDDLSGLVDDSSSEDEGIPAGGSATMSQELPPHPHAEPDTTLAPAVRTIVPPPARTCGARFSHDGKLICFFPTREQRARTLVSSATEPNKDRPKPQEPFFAGFGRLSHDSPSRYRHSEDISATDDNTDTDDAESASSSSSDSESTSIHKMSRWYPRSRQLRKTWSEDRSVRSSGGGTGTGIGTGTGTGFSRRRINRPRNLVSLHDFRYLLPSKKEFAQHYAIFGDGGKVCEHNADVAKEFGHDELANLWRYLALLLRKGIPLEVLSHDYRHTPILVIAHDVVSKCSKEGSVPFDKDDDQTLSGRVKWGRHPLAQEFISDLFDHFEKIADIQMLAMLSCIFSDSTTDDGVAYVESGLPKTETPLPLKAPSFSLDYYPTDASAWNLYGRARDYSGYNTPRTVPQTPFYAGSQASDEALWSGEPGSNSFSYEETNPYKSFGTDSDSPVPSGSKSPHARAMPARPANNHGNGSLTPALSRSFTGGSSTSPPSQLKKRPSPAETILHSIAPGMTMPWGPGASLPTAEPSTARTSLSEDEVVQDEVTPMVPVSVSVFVEDQTMFDDDGWHNAPLLQPKRASLYAHYRYAYAEMLQMWGEPLARLEIMKFNVLQEDAQYSDMDESIHGSFTIPEGNTGFHPQTGSSPIISGKRDQLHALLATGRGLDVTGICRVHEIQLEPTRYTTFESTAGGAHGSCDRCHRTQTQLRCVYCLEPVDALYPPCLSCGCASHEACLAEWHAAGETTCPAGDECNCVEEALHGHVESWAALQGAMKHGSRLHSAMLPASAIEEEDEEDAEDEEGRSSRATGGARDSTPMSNPTVVLPASASSSPASLAFGRFKKSTTESWSRASSLRRGSRKL